MSNYVKATNFFSKDALLTGNPDKIIKGAEIDDEYNAVAVAIATKANTDSPGLTGTPTAPTALPGTTSTQIATTAFVGASQGTIASQDSDAVAITGGTITGITDLTVADGGTGASTHTANSVLIGEGTSAISSVAPSTSGNVLSSDGTNWVSAAPDPSLGVGQTWQNLSASRANDVTYTNVTGKPILVCVSFNSANGGGSVYVDGVLVIQGFGVVGYGAAGLTVIVPNGSTYYATGATDRNWAELR